MGWTPLMEEIRVLGASSIQFSLRPWRNPIDGHVTHGKIQTATVMTRQRSTTIMKPTQLSTCTDPDRIQSPMHTLYVPRKILPSFGWLPYPDFASMFLAAKTQVQAWSAAYRSDPCQIFCVSTAFQTPAPLHSPAQSHPIQLVRKNYPPQDTFAQVRPPANGPFGFLPRMPDHSLSKSQSMVCPTVHDPLFLQIPCTRPRLIPGDPTQ